MIWRTAAILAFGVALAIPASPPLAALQPGKPPRGARVAVVAYHDSRLLTLCPVLGDNLIESSFYSTHLSAKAAVFNLPLGAFSGMQSIVVRLDEHQLARVLLPMPAGQAAVVGPYPSSVLQPRELDRLARDLGVERRLMERFRARKIYTVVDSPLEADFVFVAESTYVAMSYGTGSLPRNLPAFGARDQDPVRVVVAGALGSAQAETAAAGVGLLGGDRPLNWRQSIIALAVPSLIFRQHSGDGAALAVRRLWQGLVVSAAESGAGDSRTMAAAAPEALVDRFHEKGQGLPDYLPVCAATEGVIHAIDDPPDASVAPFATAGSQPGDETAPTRPARERDAIGPTFTSRVMLVRVPVAVTNREGEALLDLPVSSFRLYEDDVEQRVERLDRGTMASDIALLVDTSSGMREPREHVRTSAAAFATALRAADRAMVVKFASRVQVLSEFTSDRSALQAALAAAGPGGGTRLYDALALTAADRLIRMDGRKAVILLTDGIDTQSQLTNADAARAAMEASNAAVYVIRYETPDVASLLPPGAYGVRRWLIAPPDPEKEGEARAAGDRFLAQLSAETGGRLYAARPDAEIPEMLAHIAEEQSNQLVLAYYPANDRLDGSYRRIRVEADCDGCTVRARTGYRAGMRR